MFYRESIGPECGRMSKSGAQGADRNTFTVREGLETAYVGGALMKRRFASVKGKVQLRNNW